MKQLYVKRHCNRTYCVEGGAYFHIVFRGTYYVACIT